MASHFETAIRVTSEVRSALVHWEIIPQQYKYIPHRSRFYSPLYNQWSSVRFPKNPFWLVVSTHLKSISQTGSFPEAGMNIKNIGHHHVDFLLDPSFAPFNNITWNMAPEHTCNWPGSTSNGTWRPGLTGLAEAMTVPCHSDIYPPWTNIAPENECMLLRFARKTPRFLGRVMSGTNPP